MEVRQEVNTTAADFLKQIHAGESRMVYADWLQDECNQEGDAQLQRIIAEPNNDQHRLNYAAWLEVQAKANQVKCERCEGMKKVVVLYADETQTCEDQFAECPDCNGTGTVPNPELMERAEFIRVQVELARDYSDWPNDNGAAKDSRHRDLMNRESVLLAKYPQLRPKCVVCDGSANEAGTGEGWAGWSGPCSYCNGTGHIGELHRGFLRSVKVPRIADVFHWQPTAYARDLLRDHPTVERVECEDKLCSRSEIWDSTEYPHGIQGPVFEKLWSQRKRYRIAEATDGSEDARVLMYDTSKDATDALAVAVAETLREMVEKEIA